MVPTPRRFPASARTCSLLLLLALAPMLTYFGHWPQVRVDVPGTGGYWELPFASGHGGAGHTHAAHEASHAQHCHSDMGSCLNGTSGAIAFAALLATAVAFIGRDAPLLRRDTLVRTIAAGRIESPPTPPPRAAAFAW